MSFALSAGVTGLQAHQKMLDIAGNNLANVNTTAYKSSSITFSELLSETIKKASQATGSVGGTNPQQMGSGVGIGGIMRNMTQGNIVNTGNPLDVAMEGEGYFVINNGERDLFTRAGTFAVDEESNLVDPSTGYKVQRIGSVGEIDGFQIPGDTNIRIPYDVAMPAKETSIVAISGNLSSDSSSDSLLQTLNSDISYTYSGGTEATAATVIGDLDQFTGGSISGQITITGYDSDGNPVSGSCTVTTSTTLGDLVDSINAAFGTTATASIVGGKIRLTDAEGGYSKTDLSLSSNISNLQMPGYFEMTSVGGDEVKNVNIAVYDSQGGKHVLSAAFIRTDTINTWDMVLTAITGDVNSITSADRRIEGITFDAQTGAFIGLAGSDTQIFKITFAHDVDHPQTISFGLGSAGKFDGLTQFAGNSTAVAREQDGYEAGRLSSVSVNNEGIIIGAFSNGIKKDLATLQIALFQNTTGLESVGGNYYISSANSGEAVTTSAMTGGAGSIHGGSLEKSNADVATEFVNLIQAQNGFQANARTIRVANDILRELGNLIR